MPYLYNPGPSVLDNILEYSMRDLWTIIANSIAVIVTKMVFRVHCVAIHFGKSYSSSPASVSSSKEKKKKCDSVITDSKIRSMTHLFLMTMLKEIIFAWYAWKNPQSTITKKILILKPSLQFYLVSHFSCFLSKSVVFIFVSHYVIFVSLGLHMLQFLMRQFQLLLIVLVLLHLCFKVSKFLLNESRNKKTDFRCLENNPYTNVKPKAYAY